MPHAALTPAARTDRGGLASPTTPTVAEPRGAASGAIAIAEGPHSAARIAARSALCAYCAPAEDGQTRDAHTNSSFSPPTPPLVRIAPYAGGSLLERELAARAAGLRAPAVGPSQGAPTPGPVAPFKPFRTDPLNREPTAKPGPTALFKPFRIDPLNGGPTVKPRLDRADIQTTPYIDPREP